MYRLGGDPFNAAPGGPLANLQGQVGSVLSGAGYRPHQQNLAADMAKGAAVGVALALTWQGMKRRKAAKGEWTHPYFRFLAIWWIPMFTALAFSMWKPLESPQILGVTFLLATSASLAYLVFRALGHGRYNSRRHGSHHRSAV